MYVLSDVITSFASSVGEFGEEGLISWIVKFEGSVLTACWVSSVSERARRRAGRARRG